MHRRVAQLNAAIFFLVWLAILYAGADHPPPPGFVVVVLLDLIAAGLVYWRVPLYLAWIASRRRNALLFVVLDGLVAGLTFAALPLTARWWLGGGEPTVAPTVADSLIWLTVVGGLGMLNAVAIYIANWGAGGSARGRVAPGSRRDLPGLSAGLSSSSHISPVGSRIPDIALGPARGSVPTRITSAVPR
jgi:hypothetical protein